MNMSLMDRFSENILVLFKSLPTHSNIMTDSSLNQLLSWWCLDGDVVKPSFFYRCNCWHGFLCWLSGWEPVGSVSWRLVLTGRVWEPSGWASDGRHLACLLVAPCGLPLAPWPPSLHLYSFLPFICGAPIMSGHCFQPPRMWNKAPDFKELIF